MVTISDTQSDEKLVVDDGIDFNNLPDFEQMVSPLAMAKFWNAPDYYPWQVECQTRLFTRGSRVPLVTPNESGKTSEMIANAGLTCMALYPGSQVVSTAGSWKQIENQLLPVLRSKLAKYPGWRITEDKITAPSVRGLPPSTWVLFSTNDPGRAEGYHDRVLEDVNGNKVLCPLMYIIDEAKTVQAEIFQAMIRCDPSFALVTSSPGLAQGEFYRVVKGDSPFWEPAIEVTWNDCPHLLRGKALKTRQKLIQDLGETHPFVQSMVFGKFIEDSEFRIWGDGKSVDALFSRVLVSRRGVKRAAVDYSSGGDEQVLYIADGNTLTHGYVWRLKDATELARRIDSRLKLHGILPNNITADDGGMGEAVSDILEDMGWKGIRRYKSDDSPIDNERYFNIAAEDHFEVRRKMARGEITSDFDDPKLKLQMTKRNYEMPNDDGNRIRLEPKKKIRNRRDPSPDRLDVFVMLFKDLESPQELDTFRQRQAQALATEVGKGGSTSYNRHFGGMALEN